MPGLFDISLWLVLLITKLERAFFKNQKNKNKIQTFTTLVNQTPYIHSIEIVCFFGLLVFWFSNNARPTLVIG